MPRERERKTKRCALGYSDCRSEELRLRIIR